VYCGVRWALIRPVPPLWHFYSEGIASGRKQIPRKFVFTNMATRCHKFVSTNMATRCHKICIHQYGHTMSQNLYPPIWPHDVTNLYPPIWPHDVTNLYPPIWPHDVTKFVSTNMATRCHKSKVLNLNHL